MQVCVEAGVASPWVGDSCVKGTARGIGPPVLGRGVSVSSEGELSEVSS